MLNIPVVVFLYRRIDTLARVFHVLEQAKPAKIYLLSDAGRNKEEHIEVEAVRSHALHLITWKCEVITRFAQANLGVYENIGLGARWVFEREEKAIFLEDDNLPNLTFFGYCSELLDKYEHDERILWICGTNYTDVFSWCDSSYFFTQHLLPCGWASWSKKFTNAYDVHLSALNSTSKLRCFSRSYRNRALYRQQRDSVLNERERRLRGCRYQSWDYHMLLTLRANGLWGIAPKTNLITNIGADALSAHGGVSTALEMSRRFCDIPSKEIQLPLRHPKDFGNNERFDSLLGNIILWPFSARVKWFINKTLKRLLGVYVDDSLVKEVKKRIGKRKGQ